MLDHISRKSLKIFRLKVKIEIVALRVAKLFRAIFIIKTCEMRAGVVG